MKFLFFILLGISYFTFTQTTFALAGNSVSRTSAGITFTWEFNCGGQQCVYGQFVNGEYWVVPINQNGQNTTYVTITSISPAGDEHGAQANPVIDLEGAKKQGLL